MLLCRFEPEFLEVPPECLILTMKANQKYFPLLDAAGKLTNRFLVVSNIRPADPSRVVEGNERVVRPRLADARFFYDQDRKKTLASRVAGLDKVVYHGKLGTQGERVGRIRAIARWVAERIGADVGHADRAAELAKADLLTDMVGEFPELQGVMGGYYARHDGEPEDVADAIASQYLNRRSDDDAARRSTGRRGAADRRPGRDAGRHLGHRPEADRREGPVRAAPPCADVDRARSTASRPPAPRRRSASSLREPARGRALDVRVGRAAARYRRSGRGLRLRALREPARGRLRRADRRRGDRPAPAAAAGRAPLEAVRAFQRLDESAALAAANKRVGNILKKSNGAAPGVGRCRRCCRSPARSRCTRALGEVTPVAQARFDARRLRGVAAGARGAAPAGRCVLRQA